MNISPNVYFSVQGIPTISNRYNLNIMHLNARFEDSRLLINRDKFPATIIRYLRQDDKGYKVGVQNPEGIIRIKNDDLLTNSGVYFYNNNGFKDLSGETPIQVICKDKDGHYYFESRKAKDVEDSEHYIDINLININYRNNAYEVPAIYSEHSIIRDILSNYWVKNRISDMIKNSINDPRCGFDSDINFMIIPIGRRNFVDKLEKSTKKQGDLFDAGEVTVRDDVVGRHYSPSNEPLKDFISNGHCFYIIKLKDSESIAYNPQDLINAIDGKGKLDISEVFSYSVHTSPITLGTNERPYPNNFGMDCARVDIHCKDLDKVDYVATISGQLGPGITVAIAESKINANVFEDIIGLKSKINDIHIDFEDVITLLKNDNFKKREDFLIGLLKDAQAGSGDNMYYRLFLGKYIIGFIDSNVFNNMLNEGGYWQLYNVIVNAHRNACYLDYNEQLHMDMTDPLVAEYVKLSTTDDTGFF